MKITPVLIGLLFLGLSNALLSNVFGDHMVLQRAPGNANLFGWTKTSGKVVTVLFNGHTYQATSDRNSFWSVKLNPTPAGGPYGIQVSSSEGESATLGDVLFGDVYVCGGQSNMQFTVGQAFNASQEIASAADYPQIRVFTVGQGTISNVSLPQLATIEQPWSVSSPSSVGGKDWTYMSATCWFFGKQLAETYPSLPIGLVSSNWGGTIVQAWSSPDALAKCPQLDDVNPNQNSVLWNAMIVPFLRMTIHGAIWYQAEANANQPQYYSCAFPAMIQDWRAKWNMAHNPEFFFGFVQLAAYTEGAPPNNNLANTRIAQTAALKLNNVGMATAIDLGDLTSPAGNIHPRDKQTVAARLFGCVERLSYGGHAPCIGPIPQLATAHSLGNNNWRITVRFDPNTVDSGLMIEVKQKCEPDPTNCSTAFVTSNKGNSTEIIAVKVTGEHMVDFTVGLSDGGNPVSISYAMANWPVPVIYSVDGLPATPFVLPIH